MTHSAPPEFIRSIPDRLLRRVGRGVGELADYCLEHGYRPSFYDIEQERRRRGLRRKA